MTEEKETKKVKKETKCDELKKQIEKLQTELEETKNKVSYSQAELINYRKRKDEEVENLLKYANKDIILELIPVIDNFERAIKLDDNNLSDDLSKFLSGFKMMYSELINTLHKFGVEEIDRKGEIFDPNLEQALMTDNDPNFKDEEVLDVLLKGYKLKDRIIRPATVKINKLEKESDK